MLNPNLGYAPRAKIAVVMACMNEGPDLEATLFNMAQQYRPPDLVHVVDDCSVEPIEPRTRAAHGCFHQLLTTRNDERMIGCGASRNIGVDVLLQNEELTPDLVVIVDSHVLFPWRFFERLEQLHVEMPETVWCPISDGFDKSVHNYHFGAQMMPRSDGIWAAKWNPWPDYDKLADRMTNPGIKTLPVYRRDHEIPVPRIPVPMGACYAIPTKILRDIGGFYPNSWGWGYDEEFLAMRTWHAGYEIRLIADGCMAVRHHYRDDAHPIGARVDAHGNGWTDEDVNHNHYSAFYGYLGDDPDGERLVGRVDESAIVYGELYKHICKLPNSRKPDDWHRVLGYLPIYPASCPYDHLAERLTLRNWPIVPEDV